MYFINLLCSSTITQYTYSLTPCSTVLLEKLTGSAASQEIPRIFGTRKFITVLTSVRHLSLSWANEGSSPYSQVPAICPYPEPTPSSPHNPLPLPEDPS